MQLENLGPFQKQTTICDTNFDCFSVDRFCQQNFHSLLASDKFYLTVSQRNLLLTFFLLNIVYYHFFYLIRFRVVEFKHQLKISYVRKFQPFFLMPRMNHVNRMRIVDMFLIFYSLLKAQTSLLCIPSSTNINSSLHRFDSKSLRLAAFVSS